MRRLLVPVALAVVLGGTGMLPAAAADPSPSPSQTPAPPPPLVFPSGVPGPADVGNTAASHPTLPPGPTYVVTPGSKGTSLPAPTTAPTIPTTPTRTAVTPVPAAVRTGSPVTGATAAPVAAASPTGSTTLGPEAKVWLAASLTVLMLVLTDFTRINRRFRFRRRPSRPARPRP